MIPGLAEGRVRAARRPAPQHVPQFARSFSTPRCGSRPMPRLRFAGQITGCEGYVELAAIGLLAGRFAAAERLGEPPSCRRRRPRIGALLGHITGGHIETIDAGPRSFQPMNVNFGLFPPLGGGVARGAQKAGAVRARTCRPRCVDRRRGAAGSRMSGQPSTRRSAIKRAADRQLDRFSAVLKVVRIQDRTACAQCRGHNETVVDREAVAFGYFQAEFVRLDIKRGNCADPADRRRISLSLSKIFRPIRRSSEVPSRFALPRANAIVGVRICA